MYNIQRKKTRKALMSSLCFSLSFIYLFLTRTTYLVKVMGQLGNKIMRQLGNICNCNHKTIHAGLGGKGS